MSTYKTVPITGLWLRKEGSHLVALVEHKGDWKQVARIAIGDDCTFSEIVESSGLLRYVSENYTGAER